VPQTGQTECWDAGGNPILCDGTGQDGDLQAGVPFRSPRFTDRRNGTVRDNLTGLIWLKQAGCFPGDGNGLTWEGALQAANTLHDSAHPTPQMTAVSRMAASPAIGAYPTATNSRACSILGSSFPRSLMRQGQASGPKAMPS
jgi:hypothetical protein